MELRQVRYFMALSETLNFTRAAETCNVSQPALTNAIKKLEDEMGGPLVHRERANTHLTELGQRVLPLLKTVYENSIAASEIAGEMSSGKRASLNIGLSNDVPKAALLGPIKSAQQASPTLEIRIEGNLDSALLRSLSEGNLHMAIVDQSLVSDERLRFHPIYKEQFHVLMPDTDDLAQHEFLSIEQVCQRPWIEHIDCPAHLAIFDVLRDHNPDFAPFHKSSRSFEIQTMCQAGLGLALVGDHETVDPGLTTRAVPEFAHSRQIGLAEARGRPASPAVQSFARMLRSQSFKVSTDF